MEVSINHSIFEGIKTDNSVLIFKGLTNTLVNVYVDLVVFTRIAGTS